MEVVLIRHGETKGNTEKRYVGTTEEGLTEKGINTLKQKNYPPVQYVFVSPRCRCIETMQQIYKDSPYEIIEELAECEFGVYEYKNFMELKDEQEYQAWIRSNGTIGFPGGETKDTFKRRTLTGFWKGISKAQKMGFERVAFIVHGGSIMAILDELSMPHEEFYHWQAGNGEGFQGTLNQCYFYNIKQIEDLKLD